MENQAQVVAADEVLDIGGLEYDVSSAGATESSSSEDNQAAFYVFHYRLPDQA